jgi:hypothetical protein
MCTVTFIAQPNGYRLGMNRDESRTRAKGVPPKRESVDGRIVLAPAEPSGGMWIALNDSGASLALINWYSVITRVGRSSVSRGSVVRTVAAAACARVTHARLAELPLTRINPFRLIGIFPSSSTVVEWRWDLARLIAMEHRWTTHQWISSGFDEPAAQRMRGAVFRRALQHTPAPGPRWLRTLHRSHTPQIGPFSTCMHRADAATVSYTEIAVTPRLASLRYHAGAPCEPKGRISTFDI